MQEFSQGICGDGAAILKDGVPMKSEEILTALRALNFLVDLKRLKADLKENPNGRRKDFYDENKPKAWEEAIAALGL